MAARVQATPDPNPLQSPAVLLAEVDVSQQQQQLHDNDVHLEFMWAQQLPRSEFAGAYSVVHRARRLAPSHGMGLPRNMRLTPERALSLVCLL